MDGQIDWLLLLEYKYKHVVALSKKNSIFNSFDERCVCWGDGVSQLYHYEGVGIPANHKYQNIPHVFVSVLVFVVCWNLQFELQEELAPTYTGTS